MRSARTGLLLLVVTVMISCDELERQYSGVSGHSFMVADQFAILDNGYRGGAVTWVVVRSWPSSSTAEQRRADHRMVLGTDWEYRVAKSDGKLGFPVENTAYVFHGDRLTTFTIKMREDDFVGFRTEGFKSYDDVEAFLRRFER